MPLLENVVVNKYTTLEALINTSIDNINNEHNNCPKTKILGYRHSLGTIKSDSDEYDVRLVIEIKGSGAGTVLETAELFDIVEQDD